MAQVIKQYDSILLRWQLSVSLTDTTEVRFIMNPKTRPEMPVVEKVVSIDPIDDTVVLVALDSSETAVPGRYNVEFETTWNDGQIITFPAKGYERLTILPDLGGVVEESS